MGQIRSMIHQWEMTRLQMCIKGTIRQRVRECKGDRENTCADADFFEIKWPAGHNGRLTGPTGIRYIV